MPKDPATKRPAFQFYPGDWLRDTGLRMCSVGARGLWIDIICFMHDGEPYGYLKVNHKVILPVNLARMVGSTLQEVEGWLLELEDADVFSRDSEGAIYSRRMIRDEELRKIRADGGKKGGNPKLLDGKDNYKVDGKVNLKVDNKVNLKVEVEDNQNPTPSFAFASSSLKENTKTNTNTLSLEKKSDDNSDNSLLLEEKQKDLGNEGTMASKRTATEEEVGKPASDKKEVKRAQAEPSEVTIFKDFAKEKYQEKFKDPLVVDHAKDGKIVKNLLADISLERLKELYVEFLGKDDVFINNAGRSIGIFKTSINKLTSGNGHNQQKKSVRTCYDWLHDMEEKAKNEKRGC